MNNKTLVFLGIFALLATGGAYIEEEIGAWHFHTYFFEVNPRSLGEALAFRQALRENIDSGNFEECSLNQIYIGWDGPHPVSQYELCCNATSFAVAHSFHTQNHGNLSVLIHPLTMYDLEDHRSRASWIGKPVVLDTECPCLYPILPKPRPCPIYPRYPDEWPVGNPRSILASHIPVPGTEDYKGRNRDFNILNDPY